MENAEICKTFTEKILIRVKIYFSGLGIVPFYLNLVLLKLGKHVERVILEA